MSQDNSREEAVIDHFGLEQYSCVNRSNKYEPDAKTIIDKRNYTFELKSKPELKPNGKRKTDVSTARGFNPKKAKEWKKKVSGGFIFSEYEGAQFNGVFNAHYALTYEQLHPIIEEKVINPFNHGRPRTKKSVGYIGMKEYERWFKPLALATGNHSLRLKLEHTLEAGASLNDPKFPWKFIKENGTLIKNRKDLEAFIKANRS